MGVFSSSPARSIRDIAEDVQSMWETMDDTGERLNTVYRRCKTKIEELHDDPANAQLQEELYRGCKGLVKMLEAVQDHGFDESREKIERIRRALTEGPESPLRESCLYLLDALEELLEAGHEQLDEAIEDCQSVRLELRKMQFGTELSEEQLETYLDRVSTAYVEKSYLTSATISRFDMDQHSKKVCRYLREMEAEDALKEKGRRQGAVAGIFVLLGKLEHKTDLFTTILEGQAEVAEVQEVVTQAIESSSQAPAEFWAVIVLWGIGASLGTYAKIVYD